MNLSDASREYQAALEYVRRLRTLGTLTRDDEALLREAIEDLQEAFERPAGD